MSGAAVLVGLWSPPIKADIELPEGFVSGCPFIHEDPFDLSPILSVLKGQIAAKMENRNSCQQPAQLALTGLGPLQDFRNSIDPTEREKIAKSVYQNALTSLIGAKIQLEAAGQSGSPEHYRILSQISMIESSIYSNEIGLKSLPILKQQNSEAEYRNRLLSYTSNILDIYNSTARNYPQCIGSMGGWSTSLSSILGGVSVATGIGVNPTAQAIGAAIGLSAQLVSLLNDSKVRKSYNDLVRMGNYKSLACTYFALKRSSCEYKRAFQISQDSAKLREFFRSRFSNSTSAEYERFFVNFGRIQNIGAVLTSVAKMGSPLTLDQTVLASYIAAKAVDFVALGNPPPSSATAEIIRTWLLKAKTYGLNFTETTFVGGTNSLATQLQAASDDLANKKATVLSVESLLLKNQSFLDLRNSIPSNFPNTLSMVTEMLSYLNSIEGGNLVGEDDRAAIDAAQAILTKLKKFLSTNRTRLTVLEYENAVISNGSALFGELAKGSVAQLNQQSVLALAGKGQDRLEWAFGVIRNAYFERDQAANLPPAHKFYEYQANRNILADVIGNYRIFTGAGTTFRNEEYSKALAGFEDAFKDEFLKSIQFSMENTRGVAELKGQTAGHLCALYFPSLKFLAKTNRSAKTLLAECTARYKTLGTNRIVADADFQIDYEDECTYFKYHREIEIQNILSRLIKSDAI